MRSAWSVVWFRLVLCAAVPGFVSGAREKDPGAAWWEAGWTARFKVVLDASAAFPEGETPAGSLGPTTVLVRLHGGNFPFGAARADGADLRFVAPDHRTEYPFHLERYDELLQEAFAWVRLPDVPTDGKWTFWLYLGNPEPPGSAVAGEPVFGDEDVVVYHFGERWSKEVAGDTFRPADASAAANHAATSGRRVESALAGGGLRVNASVPVEIPAAPSLAGAEGAEATWSVWVLPESLAPGAALLRREGAGARVELGLDDARPYLEIAGNGPGRSGRLVAEPPAAAGTWCHLAVVARAVGVELWVDGKPAGRLDVPFPALDGPVTVGGAGLSGNSFTGQVDELRLARTAWSAARLRFAHVNQGPGARSASLVALEADEAHPAAAEKGIPYFSIIADTMSWDGWTIIGILAFMSLASWTVLLSKARHLADVDHANHQFIRVWNRVAGDLGALETDAGIERVGREAKHPVQPGTVHRSPLYHLYRTGWEQVAQRTGGNGAEGATLSGLAVQSVRAAMYAACIREVDKLNSKLVVLTIAIAGAPFLGLLGTVLGVTVTFISIAAAGEVNVNTIAPGVAAALTTTIVGLFVAIPALFGYNYLIAPIKRMNSELRVFVDEFITRTAELYAEHPSSVSPVLASGSGVAAHAVHPPAKERKPSPGTVPAV
jgi:biopolymer transport protein ExbB